MEEEKLFFANNEGLKLCGILAKTDELNDKCIVLCHGLRKTGKDGEIYGRLAAELARAGFASFRFDFRGHGESEGGSDDVTLSGEKEDLAVVVDFLIGLGYRKLGAVGTSFGAGAVCGFAAKNPSIFKTVIFWNPVLEYKWFFESQLPWASKNFGLHALSGLKSKGFIEIGSLKLMIGPRFIEEMKQLIPCQELYQLSLPVLFVHGEEDSIVPCSFSLKYSSLSPNFKLEMIEGAEHGFHENEEIGKRAINRTVDFIKSVFWG